MYYIRCDYGYLSHDEERVPRYSTRVPRWLFGPTGDVKKGSTPPYVAFTGLSKAKQVLQDLGSEWPNIRIVTANGTDVDIH